MGLGVGMGESSSNKKGRGKGGWTPRGLPGPVAYNGNQVPRGS